MIDSIIGDNEGTKERTNARIMREDSVSLRLLDSSLIDTLGLLRKVGQMCQIKEATSSKMRRTFSHPRPASL